MYVKLCKYKNNEKFEKSFNMSTFVVIFKLKGKVNMNRKVITAIVIAGIVILTSAITYALTNPSSGQKHKPSDYKIGVQYDEALQSDRPMLALMYVDWCGYCLKFMPKYKTLSDIYQDKFNTVMLNAEDPANKELIEDVVLSGYPTLYIIDPKYDNRILLNNAIYMDLKKLRVELDRYLRIRGLLDQIQVK